MKKVIYLIIGACIILLIFAFLTATPESDFANPKSYNSEGSRALFELSEKLGAEPFFGDPDETTNVAVLVQASERDDGFYSSGYTPINTPDQEYLEFLKEWNSDNRTLITIRPLKVDNLEENVFTAGNCEFPEINSLKLADPLFTRNNSCSFALSTNFETGYTIDITGNFFLNRYIRLEDNAEFASIILNLESNPKIAFITNPTMQGVKDQNLLDYLPGWSRLAIFQFLIFLVIVFIHLFRRFGKPTKENIPIEIPGSRLVTGTGKLFERAEIGSQSFQIISMDLQKRIKQRYGLPQETKLEVACERLATEINVNPEQINQVLTSENFNETNEQMLFRLQHLNKIDELIS